MLHINDIYFSAQTFA